MGIYDFTLQSIRGGDLSLAQFKGKKMLLVNTASMCGSTPQYKQMEEMYENYKDKLVIIGLPCNDFGGQEPGTENEVQEFCTVNYGVTFPMTTKVKIIGPERHPLYDYLARKELNGFGDTQVRWNFHKYIIDEQGNLIGSFEAPVEPLSDEIMNLIEKQK